MGGGLPKACKRQGLALWITELIVCELFIYAGQLLYSSGNVGSWGQACRCKEWAQGLGMEVSTLSK